MRPFVMTICDRCGAELYFDKHHKSASCKFIPMEKETDMPHDCPKKPAVREPQILKCYRCGGEIYFDDKHLSPSGKKIPIDYETEEPHQCPANPKEKGRAWTEDQNYWRRKSK